MIVSNYTEGTLDQKAALDHARVVGECFRTSTVLPFRFGTVFQTEDESAVPCEPIARLDG